MYSTRNYPLLLASQFLGAFGDNAVLAVIVGQLTYLRQSGAISSGELRSASTIYASLLFVPFVVFAPIAGYLNDRFSKTSWLAGGNVLKLLGTLICAFTVDQGAVWQGFGYFVVGVGSCFYGPAKYGVLPEILPRERLVRANGMVELLTLLAVLTGAIGGAALSDAFHSRAIVAFLIVGALFGGALICSLAMTRTPSDSTVKFAASARAFGQSLAGLYGNPRLARILVGTALFWVCGASMKINFQPWGLQTLGLANNTEIALLGLWLSLGVMVGSVLAGKLHKVGDLRGARWYGLAMAATLALLFFVTPGSFWTAQVVRLAGLVVPVPVAGVLILTGVAAGLFLIPLNAALQAESDPTTLGKTIAVQNLGDNLGMCLASAYVFAAVRVGLSASGVFLGLAVWIVAAMIYFSTRRGQAATLRQTAVVR